MWCVASAPIVPLARDLDAALGMELSKLAVHFRTPPTPLLTAPLPSRAAPAFLPQTVRATPHNPTPLSGCTRTSSAHRPRRSDSPRGQSPRLPAPASRPAPQHATPSAWPPLQWDLSSENTKKRAPFLGERCSFWVAKRSTFGRVVLTCATMDGHTGRKRVRRRGLACATCAVDLIDATLHFGIAAGKSVFAHSAVAIDAAHHFAGGLFHTACGRLCGRGGRGRRRGGRARR